MKSELRTLGRWPGDRRIRVAVAGARPAQAESQARRLAAEGCRALLSWGVAGGLDPALAPGTLLIPAEIASENGDRWRLAEMTGRGCEAGSILGLDRMVLAAAEKSGLHALTGADAVDMESHRIALVAAEAGLPAIAVRAIGDPAGQTLPELVTRALDENGRPRIALVIAGLIRRPGDIRTLLRLNRDTSAALASLAAAADQTIAAILDRL
jgi:adenosylhomocysteine nucleosidase